MNTIVISDPFDLHLKQKRPFHIINGLHVEAHERGSQSPDMTIPPLNTNINFLKHSPYYSDQDHLDLHIKYATSTTSESLPDVYDWRFNYPFDTSQTKKIKRLIMPPDNQYLCGSCWAMSTTSVIGDAFVVAGLVDWTPRPSTTWALTCYPQGKCEGGNPALLLQQIAQGPGIPSKYCLDYSFCSENKKCNGQAVQHFQAQNLSSLVPTECGCYYGGESVKHYNFKINNDVKTFAIGEGATSFENIQSSVKKHILLHGPVIAGFFVMKNFGSGYFTKTNGGVYLEKGNYIQGQKLTFSASNASGMNYAGAHAVAIIGWGIAKNIFYENDKRGDVPYWYCRNSWGGKWGGDSGYFKIAMYPYNKIAQFGKIVDIVDAHGQKHRCGGIMTFTVSMPPELKAFKAVQQRPPVLMDNITVYNQSENLLHSRLVQSQSSQLRYIILFVALIVVFLWTMKIT
jgi:hypothetical protein